MRVLQLWEKNGVFSPEIIHNLLHMEMSESTQTATNTSALIHEVSAATTGMYFTRVLLFWYTIFNI